MARQSEVRAFPGLGVRLNDAMFRQGLTRRDLAKRSKLSHETLNQALNDRATARTVERLEDALALAPGELAQVWEARVRDAAVPYVVESTPEVSERVVEIRPSPTDEIDRLVHVFERLAAREGFGPRFLFSLLSGLEEGARLARKPLPPSYWDFRRQVYSELVETEHETAE